MRLNIENFKEREGWVNPMIDFATKMKFDHPFFAISSMTAAQFFHQQGQQDLVHGYLALANSICDKFKLSEEVKERITYLRKILAV